MTAHDETLKETLRSPDNEAEWTAYHDIRRHVLFELRGRGASYDADHPDERRSDNHPLMLWSGEKAIGVIRIDIEERVATFRRVAIRPEVQRQGYGRKLLLLAEQFAKRHACTRIESHVDHQAILFYERCGFERLAGPRQTGDAVLMWKPIA